MGRREAQLQFASISSLLHSPLKIKTFYTFWSKLKIMTYSNTTCHRFFIVWIVILLKDIVGVIPVKDSQGNKQHTEKMSPVTDWKIIQRFTKKERKRIVIFTFCLYFSTWNTSLAKREAKNSIFGSWPLDW